MLEITIKQAEKCLPKRFQPGGDKHFYIPLKSCNLRCLNLRACGDLKHAAWSHFSTPPAEMFLCTMTLHLTSHGGGEMGVMTPKPKHRCQR